MFRVCARATDLPQSIGPFVRMGRHAPGGGKAPAVLQVRQEALPHPRGAAAKTARNSALPLTYGKLSTSCGGRCQSCAALVAGGVGQWTVDSVYVLLSSSHPSRSQDVSAARNSARLR